MTPLIINAIAGGVCGGAIYHFTGFSPFGWQWWALQGIAGLLFNVLVFGR